MLISAELATANIEMNGMMLPIGSPGAPIATTSTSGVSLAASVPTGTSATDATETRT